MNLSVTEPLTDQERFLLAEMAREAAAKKARSVARLLERGRQTPEAIAQAIRGLGAARDLHTASAKISR